MNNTSAYLRSVALYLLLSVSAILLVFVANLIAPIFNPSLRIWSSLLNTGLFSIWGALVVVCICVFSYMSGRTLAKNSWESRTQKPIIVGLIIIPISLVWVFLVAGIATPIELLITAFLTGVGLSLGDQNYYPKDA
jgi:hypothetical protein